MSFLNKVKQFSRTPQGRKLTQQAKHAAKDPKTRSKVRDLFGSKSRSGRH